jgi:hypothetical protein
VDTGYIVHVEDEEAAWLEVGCCPGLSDEEIRQMCPELLPT